VTASKSGFPTRAYTAQVLATGQMLRENFDLGYATVTSPAGTVVNGWSLLSLPYMPANPDPASVFIGINIDGNLYRWDNPTQGLFIYDSWSPEQFGSVNIDNGYWLQSGSAANISYQAYGGTSAQRTISLPTSGWAIMGCPFAAEKQWADTLVKHGTQTASMFTASRTNNWMNSAGYWWDAVTQGLSDFGIPEDFVSSEIIQPWHGYWVQTYVNDVSLVLK
jgi:hypothetical protein